jgi:NO-binding membrane sensor protein with MHYT domain
MMVGHGPRNVPKTVAAGVLTGGGVLAMHYTGMLGMHVAGEIRYDVTLVIASAVIAVVASTVALWFTVSVRAWMPISGAAAIMAVAVCGMHYTGMAAMTVHLDPRSIAGVTGFRPLTMIVPITLLTAASIIGVALSALQAMTEEEFTDGAGTPKRGVHAEPGNPWSLKQATAATAARRPSPRPVPIRSPTNG